MPNLRGKTWATTTPANVEDAQYWEDHLISDEDAAKIGEVVLPSGGTSGQVLTKQSTAPNDAIWDDPASSGHTIQDEDGMNMPYQPTLQFISAEVTENSANSKIIVDCKGSKGDPGPQGYSPEVTITGIPGGHRVNITDLDHPQGQNFDVMDGAGIGDMQAAYYDANYDVYNAGGIPNYVNASLSNKVDKVAGKGLSTNDYSDTDKAIVDGVTNALANKVDKVTGKGLSENDYTDADKAIVDGVTAALATKADQSLLAPIQTTLTASKAYAVGEQFVYSGLLYRVTQAIASGGTIIIGTNAELAPSVTEQIDDKIIIENTSVTLGALSSGSSGWTSKDVTKAGYVPLLCNVGLSSLAIVKGDLIAMALLSGNTLYMNYRAFNTVQAAYSVVNIAVLYKKI